MGTEIMGSTAGHWSATVAIPTGTGITTIAATTGTAEFVTTSYFRDSN